MKTQVMLCDSSLLHCVPTDLTQRLHVSQSSDSSTLKSLRALEEDDENAVDVVRQFTSILRPHRPNSAITRVPIQRLKYPQINR